MTEVVTPKRGRGRPRKNPVEPPRIFDPLPPKRRRGPSPKRRDPDSIRFDDVDPSVLRKEEADAWARKSNKAAFKAPENWTLVPEITSDDPDRPGARKVHGNTPKRVVRTGPVLSAEEYADLLDDPQVRAHEIKTVEITKEEYDRIMNKPVKNMGDARDVLRAHESIVVDEDQNEDQNEVIEDPTNDVEQVLCIRIKNESGSYVGRGITNSAFIERLSEILNNSECATIRLDDVEISFSQTELFK